MRILITNDDGIHAEGIYALAKEMSKKHEITVVAPREQKSACSHSISLEGVMKVKEEKLEGLACKAYSVLGTPADCTQIGLALLAKDAQLVISGINRGLNCGTDVLYSGTVSAAIEGAINHVPSIAISMEVDWEKHDEEYEKAALWVSKIVDIAEKKFLRKDVVLNINVPNRPEHLIKGLKVCGLGQFTYRSEYILLEDKDERVYTINAIKSKIEESNTDRYYLSEGYVTLTPLQFDFTHYKMLQEVENIFNR